VVMLDDGGGGERDYSIEMMMMMMIMMDGVITYWWRVSSGDAHNQPVRKRAKKLPNLQDDLLQLPDTGLSVLAFPCATARSS